MAILFRSILEGSCNQTQPQPNVQTQPTPFVSASSAPMPSMPMSFMPPELPTYQSAAASATTFQSAAASASASPYNFDAMWQQLLPEKYGSLIFMFCNDRRPRNICEVEDQIPKVLAFLEAWENVPKNKQPKWYHDALADYSIENRLQ
eukprot:6182359-Amphidinium_carterae.1